MLNPNTQKSQKSAATRQSQTVHTSKRKAKSEGQSWEASANILVYFYKSFYKSEVLDFKKVWMENEELRLLWRVVTFMKCCDFYEKLWLL